MYHKARAVAAVCCFDNGCLLVFVALGDGTAPLKCTVRVVNMSEEMGPTASLAGSLWLHEQARKGSRSTLDVILLCTYI